jgi:hypothetical protein
MDRLRTAVYGTVLLLCIGWVLHVGKAIFVPALLGAVPPMGSPLAAIAALSRDAARNRVADHAR